MKLRLMRLRVLVPVLGLLALGGAVVRPTVVLADGTCGLVPLKPLTPLGCKDLAPVCVCDSAGKNCRYSWVCVK